MNNLYKYIEKISNKVKKDDYIGKNYGKIAKIADDYKNILTKMILNWIIKLIKNYSI